MKVCEMRNLAEKEGWDGDARSWDQKKDGPLVGRV